MVIRIHGECWCILSVLMRTAKCINSQEQLTGQCLLSDEQCAKLINHIAGAILGNALCTCSHINASLKLTMVFHGTVTFDF